MIVGILALQGAFAAHRRRLASLGVATREIRTPADLTDEVSALVLPGGESTTMSMMLERSGLLTPLRRRLAEGLPAFGTCAGMILLARRIVDGRPDQHALGLVDITVRRNAYGTQIQSFETDLEVAGLDEPFHAVFIRAPAVVEVGPGVEVLARVADQPVLCRQGPVVVAAFHPELTDDDRLHRCFLEMARPAAATP
ncbi:MAG: pyridoxal 5'-phosphate synthase glutaminase subunit PdxT [Actinomyces sp.]|nr:MAG: pyridoxal 5'-phosphate synthase glutaminase subunit PdxT [Actinomyces sp.]